MAGFADKITGEKAVVFVGTPASTFGLMKFTVLGEIADTASDWNDAHSDAVGDRDTLNSAAEISADPALQQGIIAEAAVAGQKVTDLEAIKPQFTGLGAEFGPYVIAACVGYTVSRIGQAVLFKAILRK